MNIVYHILVSALAIIITAYVVPGASVTVESAIVAALILAVVNVFLKPILLILTLPINILTLGLFTFVINAGLILLVSKLVSGFEISNFTTAFLFAIVMSLVNILFGFIS